MGYRFERDETVTDGVHRIGTEQVKRAQKGLRKMSDPVATVHDVRKRCKKLRALVRLVRPEMGDYGDANRLFRDAARELAPFRDAHAVAGTFDDLAASHAHLLPEAAVEAVRGHLAGAAEAASAAVEDAAGPVERAAHMIDEGMALIEEWSGKDRFGTLRGGLVKTYKRARNRMDDAAGVTDPSVFHQWRKRVKYHWYHTRLVRDAAPSILRPRAKNMHDLSDALGDAHDLAVLVAGLRADEDLDPGHAEAVCVVADGVRTDLERRSLSVGARLLAEKPGALADRLERYWDVWHDLGPELDAGELDAVWDGD